MLKTIMNDVERERCETFHTHKEEARGCLHIIRAVPLFIIDCPVLFSEGSHHSYDDSNCSFTLTVVEWMCAIICAQVHLLNSGPVLILEILKDTKVHSCLS